MKCYLELSLRSETCFAGSGGGRVGSVDTDLETDTRTGLPLVRGRTLKGLLLEELALILHTLEPGPPGFWHATAAHLFGTPGQSQRGILTFHDGHLPADLQAAVLNNRSWRKTEVLAALTTIRQQTKMDANTGAPETHSLRSTRLLRAGLRLRATMYAGQPLSTAGRALFAAGVAAVRRAGLHRNHGWGEVQLRVLDEQEQDVTAAWLRGLMQPVTEPLTAGVATGHEPPAQPIVVSSTAQAPAVASRQVLSYRLTLTTPAVLATTGGDPSTVATQPFISGAAVLGALVQRWLARAPQGHDAAGDPQFQRCFLDGSVRWLNAYPEGGSSNRLLPCPLSLVQRKGQSGIAYDQASPLFIDVAAKEPRTQWQRLEAPFISIMETDQSEYQLRERKLTLIPRLHHTRDDREAGRSKNGAMFSYIALEAGEQFMGHILCETPDDAATHRDGALHPLRLSSDGGR